MQQTIIFEKITECMKTIFSFTISRTRNHQEAEDLSQEIISELFRSANALRDEKAFYGWMWAIANNVYKGYLRKQKSVNLTELDENIHAYFNDMPEQALIEREKIDLLRRELSLLSEQYRQAVIKYYVEDKSCHQISKELKISVEMVKYLLFKARKILREGMNMTRTYGEKSYNPEIFKIDYWGNGPNDTYWRLFERRLPGNILLSAYYEPLTIEEMSLELGVAAPYLEDELSILLKHNLVRLFQNGRYQTNIIIFTESCENELYEKTKHIYDLLADKLHDFITAKETDIRKLGFYGSEFSKNRLFWGIAHIALLNGMEDTDQEYQESFKRYPLLSNGSYGYLWGWNRSYDNHLFNGIYGCGYVKPKTDWLHVTNYKILQSCQCYYPDDHEIKLFISSARENIQENDKEILADLLSKGYITKDIDAYKPNFPVFTEEQYGRLQALLQPIISEITKSINGVISIGEKVLQNHAPVSLKDQCYTLAHIRYQMDVMAYTVGEMCSKGHLFIPKTSEKLTMFIVLKDEISSSKV